MRVYRRITGSLRLRVFVEGMYDMMDGIGYSGLARCGRIEDHDSQKCITEYWYE
jgi:hypothetical protein